MTERSRIPVNAICQCARDRRRRQRQHIDGLLELLDALLVGDAEALLFVDDQEPEVMEG